MGGPGCQGLILLGLTLHKSLVAVEGPQPLPLHFSLSTGFDHKNSQSQGGLCPFCVQQTRAVSEDASAPT